MAANGAEENTLRQFEQLLGGESLSVDVLNQYYKALIDRLYKSGSAKVKIANGIWFDKSFTVKETFLQKNSLYFNAAVNIADLGKQQSIDDINKWVLENTDGLIDKIIDRIDPNVVMYIINTIFFEAEWKDQIDPNSVREDEFTSSDGKKYMTDFMYSREKIYLENEKTKGFMKPYKDDRYSFVAMLPDNGTDIDSFVNSLRQSDFSAFIKNKKDVEVHTRIPKFEYSYENELSAALKRMGLNDVFDRNKANLKGMTDEPDIFASKVMHKTKIQINEAGSKAGAATAIYIEKWGMASDYKTLIFDRPFVYAIIENQTNIPLFIGTVHNPTLG